MNKPIKLIEWGFEGEWIDVPLTALHHSKAVPTNITTSKKYLQIRASVEAIGLVEPLVVIPHASQHGCFSILDGHLRAEALRDLGAESARCLIAKDDEAYTYNKRVSRLASIQEHKMIMLAYKRGASAERLSVVLGIAVKTIQMQFKMLDDICDEAIKILADKPVPRRVFSVLRQMDAFRQIDVANAMIGLGNYTFKLAQAMLQTTPQEHLVEKFKKKVERGGTIETVQRLERELASIQNDTKLLEEDFGPDNLKLAVVKTHITSLLDNARVVRWLAQFKPDYLRQLQIVAEIKQLPSDPERKFA